MQTVARGILAVSLLLTSTTLAAENAVWKAVFNGTRIESCVRVPQSRADFVKEAGKDCKDKEVPTYGTFTIVCDATVTGPDFTLTERECENYKAQFNTGTDPMFSKPSPQANEKFGFFNACFADSKAKYAPQAAADYCKCTTANVHKKYSQKQLKAMSADAAKKAVERAAEPCRKSATGSA